MGAQLRVSVINVVKNVITVRVKGLVSPKEKHKKAASVSKGSIAGCSMDGGLSGVLSG